MGILESALPISFSPSVPKSAPSTTILTSALTTSLTNLGYDPYLIQRAALLANSNTHTIECHVPSESLDTKTLLAGTHHALAKLFEDAKDRDVRINTNEPVLLINGSTALDAGELHLVTDTAASVLRDVHSVRPVRIYAGNFISTADEKVGFSISLLNVVNTDIGGPGMVSLLDDANWQARGAVRREKWEGNGWDCVERVEWEQEYQEVPIEGTTSETGASEDGEWESEAEGDVEEEASGKTTKKEEHAEAGKELDNKVEGEDVLQGTPESVEDESTVQEITEAPEEDGATSEPPAEDPWSQRPQLRDIKHPSWEREHDKQSLLDMIESQSKRLPVSKSGNAYATAALKEKANLSGEDEYEVV